MYSQLEIHQQILFNYLKVMVQRFTNITSYTSSGNALHGVVVCSSVNGTFVPGETITGGTSSNTAIIQANAVGLKGVTSFDFTQVKQLGMAGSTHILQMLLETLLTEKV